MKKYLLPLILAAAPGLPLQAEEGGSGHYLPGSMSSFTDSVPAEETFITRLNLLYFEGSFSKDQPLPFAGLQAAGVDAQSFATGISML